VEAGKEKEAEATENIVVKTSIDSDGDV